MAKLTRGRRVDCPFADDGGLLAEWPAPGDYWFWANGGGWQGVSPNGHMVTLSKHTVVEHEDGTITVSPSILVGDTKNPNLWHGYLEHGVWREC